MCQKCILYAFVCVFCFVYFVSSCPTTFRLVVERIRFIFLFVIVWVCCLFKCLCFQFMLCIASRVVLFYAIFFSFSPFCINRSIFYSHLKFSHFFHNLRELSVAFTISRACFSFSPATNVFILCRC